MNADYKPTAWLTYAWGDNKAGDVDFLAQELTQAGVDIRLDRWNLKAGRRLWEQIADFITNPKQSDAWLFYATQTSLGSEACKEEFAYALERAVQQRGREFPIIALFPATMDRELIPPGIRIRLYVSLAGPDWKERVVAGVEGRAPDIEIQKIQPYSISIHDLSVDPNYQGSHRICIEVRPRAGS